VLAVLAFKSWFCRKLKLRNNGTKSKQIHLT